MTGRGPIRQSLTVMIWGAVATSAIAQSSPFDMSPERPAQTVPKPAEPPAISPVEPRREPEVPTPAQPPVPPPFAAQPAPSPDVTAQPPPVPPVTVPARRESISPGSMRASSSSADGRRRYILPMKSSAFRGKWTGGNGVSI